MSFWEPFKVFSEDPFFRDPFFSNATGLSRGILTDPRTSSSNNTDIATRNNNPIMSMFTSRTPKMDVTETEKSYLIQADLPGMKKEEIHIHIQDDILTLEGERKIEREESDATHHLVERSFGKFSRAFRLPQDADPEKVKATMNHGVLKLFLEKQQLKEGNSKKKIEIN